MANFLDINFRLRSELSELSEITFSDEELFLYVVEGSRLMHGMIATINPSFLLSGKKIYEKVSDYTPYTSMEWYSDYQAAVALLEENGADPYYVLPEKYQYLDVNNDGTVNLSDYNAIVALDVITSGTNSLYTWLDSNDKLTTVDFSTLTLPTDCMFIYGVYITIDNQTYKMSPTNLDRIMFFQDGEYPTMFCRVGNNLQVAPAPTEPVKITLYYVPSYIAPTTESGDFNISDMFMPFVIEYAVLRAHNRNDRKTLVEQVFLNQKGELIQNLLQREEIHLQVVPTLTNYPYLSTY